MSILSNLINKTFGKNAVKTGVILGSAYFGSKFLFGKPGEFGGYDPNTLYGKVFNSIGDEGLTHFRDTSFGQSALGKGISNVGNFLGVATGSGPSLLSTAISGQFSRPPAARLVDTGGFGVRSDTAFQATQAQPFPIGRGGAFQNAVRNDSPLEYMARQVRTTIGAPSASALPTASSIAAAPSIYTTKSSRRAYSRVTST